MINLRRRLVPLSLLVVVALAACSSSSTASARAAADPSIKQSASVAPPAPAPSPEPTTNAAIEAGVRQWFVAVNKAFSTGDSRALRERSEGSCPCLIIARQIEDTWSHGRIQGLMWSLRRVQVVNVNLHIAQVQVDYDETAYRVASGTKVLDLHAADEVEVLTDFAFRGGEWRMWSFQRIKATPK